MSQIDPREIAKDRMDKNFESLQYSQGRQNYSVDWLSRIGTETATIFFAFAGVFAKDFLPSASIWEVRMFVIGLIFLFTSIFAGFIQIRLKAFFWSDMADIFQDSARKWQEAWEEKIQNKEADSYVKGLTQDKKKASVSAWPWRTQITLLLLGTALIMISYISQVWR